MARAPEAKKGSQIALFQQQEAPEPFKKAVQAIHVSPVGSALSLQQRRIFNALIKNAIEQRLAGRETNNTFQVSIPQMMSALDLTTKDNAYIKETAKSLMRTVVDWDQLNSDGTSTWTGSTLIAGAKISGSVLSYSFAPQISEELLDPQRYAMIDMRIAKLFRRSYSLALWENTVRFERIGLTARIPLATFRNLILGREESETKYKEYKIFKRAVLTPSIAEINDVSDHEIELIEHKVGRTVGEIQFKISRKVSALEEEPHQDLVNTVIKFGVPQTEAKRLVRTFGAERVLEAVSYTRARQAKKGMPPLDNVPAYFRKSLSEDWGKGSGKVDGVGVGQQQQTPQARSPKTEEDARAQYLAARIPQAQGYFGELSPDEQSTILSRYNDQCSVKEWKVVTGKKLSKAAETNFFKWIAHETWGEPTAGEILNFVLSGKV
ncbi:RepB family plasmid replication initiator protein [Ralstonia solanacearum]|uniref:replication initiation protein n=1 Tax=Ralstonia solanacearum TaxID=305 RepID=UPI0001816585|nr:RepB family plasmid replication initiator protein [Ralstonia solanacearum]MDC6179746.1 RepB family plasmid replication initiator protein [Ralstonia solanacearum]MDC6239624.1 RepB family plasmid replication initiator protein [Ralstonia solanacearum]TYZ56047.1 RepB family plasmid replication initiator protein [Ralstonia solanacearum]